MRKILGTFFIIISFIISMISIGIISEIHCNNTRIENQIINELNADISENDFEKEQIKDESPAILLMLIGVIFLIIGLYLLISKTKKHRDLITELKLLKNNAQQ